MVELTVESEVCRERNERCRWGESASALCGDGATYLPLMTVIIPLAAREDMLAVGAVVIVDRLEVRDTLERGLLAVREAVVVVVMTEVAGLGGCELG